MQKNVYILSDGGHDYSDAERFGTLVFLPIPANAKWDIAALFDTLTEGLKDAEAEDYLIISHLTSVCCVATAILVEQFGRVNFLLYRGGKYEERVLVTDNK